jgi:2-dehydro-3-deoxyphosphooctonate aldolase (KDO 8-P synthase)
MKNIEVGTYQISNDQPLILIAGPCALESRDHALFMSEKLKEICEKLGVDLVYKTSFDKANRTSLSGERGLGLSQALPIFNEIKEQYKLPCITDVHLPDQCSEVASVVDILQIPAFLCRQTDLLIAAAKTGRAINVKKGQFLAPWDMKNVVQKIIDSGNDNIMLCERGASFGYNTLVSDMRSLPIMAQTGFPVIYDATHSVQQPGGKGTSTGGDRDMVPVLARAAAAVGVAGIFMEVHQDPESAPSDGPNMVILNELEEILKPILEIDSLVKSQKLCQQKAVA